MVILSCQAILRFIYYFYKLKQIKGDIQILIFESYTFKFDPLSIFLFFKEKERKMVYDSPNHLIMSLIWRIIDL